MNCLMFLKWRWDLPAPTLDSIWKCGTFLFVTILWSDAPSH